MTKKKPPQQSFQFRDKKPSDELPPKDLARFLKRLSSLYHDPKSGNIALSAALAKLSTALLEGSHLTLAELFGENELRSKSGKTFDSDELKSLNIETIMQKLTNRSLSKTELIEIGAERFNIPRSGLKRMNVVEISDRILSAARHEESLNIISKEAQRGGKERSS